MERVPVHDENRLGVHDCTSPVLGELRASGSQRRERRRTVRLNPTKESNDQGKRQSASPGGGLRNASRQGCAWLRFASPSLFCRRGPRLIFTVPHVRMGTDRIALPSYTNVRAPRLVPFTTFNGNGSISPILMKNSLRISSLAARCVGVSGLPPRALCAPARQALRYRYVACAANGGGCGMSFASFLRFWAAAANVNSS